LSLEQKYQSLSLLDRFTVKEFKAFAVCVIDANAQTLAEADD